MHRALGIGDSQRSSAVDEESSRLGCGCWRSPGPDNDDWLASLGVLPVNHGEGLDDRLRDAAPHGIDAVLDAYGSGYVQQAIRLGVASDRIVTIIDFPAAEAHGAKTLFGYQVAYTRLAERHTRGKIVLRVAD